MMEVFRDIDGVFTEQIAGDLIELVEKRIKAEEGFHIKSVPQGMDPVKPDGVLGYEPSYGIAYMSNPTHRRGNIGIHPNNRKLIYNPNEDTFFNQRDAYVFGYQQLLFVRPTFEEILQEFQGRGYTFHEFISRTVGDTITNYKSPAELPVGRQLILNELL